MLFQLFARHPLLPLILSISVLFFMLTACGSGSGNGKLGNGSNNDDGGVIGLSQKGSTNSHNDSRRGANCMECHVNGGPGTGAFVTAGTAIQATGGYVEYYADLARTDLRARLEVDAYGNFYTVNAIDLLTPNMSGLSPGAYITIVMPGGTTRNMPGAVSHTSASCNVCHSAGGTQSPL